MCEFLLPNSVFDLRKEIYDDLKEYKEDYKKVIKQRENDRIPFLHQSPQINYRKRLVNYIKKVCFDKSLSQSCLHLAVYLLDIFMDNHEIMEERLMLVTNVSIMLAAKSEESSTRIPKVYELNSFVGDKYTLNDYRNLEILMLTYFDFFIIFPTAAHYVFYYMQEFNDHENFYYEVYDAITTHLDKILDDVRYMQYYLPSKLAAGVIAASRIDVGLTFWTVQLEDFTEYTEEDLTDVVQSLLEGTFQTVPTCAHHQVHFGL